jgi:hypothetical protein
MVRYSLIRSASAENRLFWGSGLQPRHNAVSNDLRTLFLRTRPRFLRTRAETLRSLSPAQAPVLHSTGINSCDAPPLLLSVFFNSADSSQLQACLPRALEGPTCEISSALSLLEATLTAGDRVLLWGGASGHTYDFTRYPDGTTFVDLVVVREGKNFKGRLLGFVLRTIGRSVLEKAFVNSVKAIEARNVSDYHSSRREEIYV